MKLISVKLYNFRQFYGRTPEIFLASGKRNTTVIHGNNGAGKTTVLNAFTWVLYEKFTAAFAAHEQLLNNQALAEAPQEGSVECSAEISFEHDNKSYQLKRRCYGRNLAGRVDYTPTQLFMLVAGDDGCWRPPQQQPDDIIGQILPESLHRYFFFDGERIDHIIRYDKKHEIAEATKVILGIKVLERSVDHLKKAKRTLEAELRGIGDIEIQRILLAKEGLEKERDRVFQRQEEIIPQLNQQDSLKKTLNERLLNLSGAQELQNFKTQLQSQESSLRQNLLQAQKKIKQAISNFGYEILLTPRISQFENIIQDLRQKGEIPAGIKRQFVQELLTQQSCICGTELLPDSLPYRQVESWREKAGIAHIEETAIHLEAKVKDAPEKINLFWQIIDQEQEVINQGRLKLAQVENSLDATKQKLRNYPDENIQNLQKEVDSIESKIRSFTLEQGRNQQQITKLTEDIKDKEKQLAKQHLKETQQNLVQRRIQSVQDSIERIIEVRKLIETEFRASLEIRVQEIFTSISFTPYLPKLSDKYELSLIDKTAGMTTNIAASTGENQILSLSFIGGIIDRVREWSQKNTLIGHDSSTFPIIMDSPFGSLDEIYRRQVAKAIPLLANQLIVLVTKTQWRGEVEEEMFAYLGKEYVLVYYSPKPDCQEDYLEVDGKLYPLVKQSNKEFEYTEIIEIERSIN